MLNPNRDRILVRRNEPEREIGSILLPEFAQEKDCSGIVEACGNRVQEVKVGDEIIFHSPGGEYSTYDGVDLSFGEYQNHVIIPESSVLCIIERELLHD